MRSNVRLAATPAVRRGDMLRAVFSKSPLIAAVVALVLATGLPAGTAQEAAGGNEAEGPDVPLFIDPNRTFEKPADVPSSITFLTSLDFPPFNFVGSTGKLTGFHVDLARAICDELRVRCQMRVVEFGRIMRRLVDGRGDAAIAGLAETERTRRRLKFTVPYLRMAGRFVASSATPTGLAPATAGSAKVSVVEGSAHAAFLAKYFPEAEVVAYKDAAAARQALRADAVALHFGDAVSLSFWLQSEAAAGCCTFHGGPFFDETYFGRGLSIAVPEEATALRATLNYALQRLVANGTYAELYLRYFPISPF